MFGGSAPVGIDAEQGGAVVVAEMHGRKGVASCWLDADGYLFCFCAREKGGERTEDLRW